MTWPWDSAPAPPLSDDVHIETGRELEAALLELVDLSILGNQLRWSVDGPMSWPLRLILSTFVDAWHRMANETAERAVAIGYWPDAQADAVAASPEHTAVPPGPIEDQAVVSLLTQYLEVVVERTRARIRRLSKLDDVSEHVITNVCHELERQLSTARVQLPRSAERYIGGTSAQPDGSSGALPRGWTQASLDSHVRFGG